MGNPTLLTGIAKCGTCGSGMTLRTGKSGRYRYYTCAGCAQKGKTICPGRSISMAALDGMILEHLADRLFTPERLQVILEAFINQSAAAGCSTARATAAGTTCAHRGAGQDQPAAGAGGAGDHVGGFLGAQSCSGVASRILREVTPVDRNHRKWLTFCGFLVSIVRKCVCNGRRARGLSADGSVMSACRQSRRFLVADHGRCWTVLGFCPCRVDLGR